MNASSRGRQTVAVLLSGREKFSPYYGGALARWTYEVYSRLDLELSVTVFGFPTAASDLYQLSHQTHAAFRACQLLSHVPIARRYEDHVWLRSLRRRLAGFDIVHIHNRPQWAKLLRELGYDGSIVLHLQNDHLGHWTSPMLNRLADHVDAVAVCSGFLGRTFADKSHAIAVKTHVIFNGVDIGIFTPREELRENKTIFFVGRFDQEKGVLQLVRAYQRVLQDHPDAKLVIGGASGFGVHRETAYVREVRGLVTSLVAKHGANIHLTGYLHHDRDLPGWFQRASVFACPSLFEEPFGLVNAEAMACATPVVGSNRGGIPEVLGASGKLVDPEDTIEFSSALSELLSRPEQRAESGRQALERCRTKFDWGVIAQSWRSLLQDVNSRQSPLAMTGT